jgi:hypothetical protein
MQGQSQELAAYTVSKENLKLRSSNFLGEGGWGIYFNFLCRSTRMGWWTYLSPARMLKAELKLKMRAEMSARRSS